MSVNMTQIYNASNAAGWRRIVFGDNDDSITIASTVTFTGVVNISGSIALAGALLSSPTLSGTVAGTPTWASSQAITLSTAAQPNITSLGTIASLVTSGTTTFNTVAYTWPSSVPGTSGFVLSSTTGGVLSWITVGGLPLTGAAQADPAAPAANNLTLFVGQFSASTPAMLRVEDALNQPYWVGQLVQSRRRTLAVTPYKIPGYPSYLQFTGTGLSQNVNPIWDNTTSSLAGSVATFPYRPSIALLGDGVGGGTTGYVRSGATDAYFGASAGLGGVFVRIICGVQSTVSTVGKLMTGFVYQSTSDPTATTKHNGIYFYRDSGVNSGNWSVSSDNNTTRTSNVDTTIAFTVSHLYELLLYVAPNSTQVYWQVNDLTAATTASGNFAGTVLTGTGTQREVLAVANSSNTGYWNFCGLQIEYDSRII